MNWRLLLACVCAASCEPATLTPTNWDGTCAQLDRHATETTIGLYGRCDPIAEMCTSTMTTSECCPTPPDRVRVRVRVCSHDADCALDGSACGLGGMCLPRCVGSSCPDWFTCNPTTALCEPTMCR